MSDTFPARLPTRFETEEALDNFLALPDQKLRDDMASLDGDIMVLGVGGKMGPSLARLAKSAAPDKKIIGVARFSDKAVEAQLNDHGVETITADLLDRDALAALPDVPNIVFMAGRKFGSGGSEELTWAMNTLVPAMVADRFTKARITSFSTGCVYPFVPITSQGATEDVALDPPGEYAQSCVGRERMFTHFSKQHGNPGAIIRLNYAIDMRYGVLFDIATKVAKGLPVNVETGHVNVIWQGDANAQVLRSLWHCESPPNVFNVSGPETISVRWVAQQFAKIMGKPAEIVGQEAPTGWLTNNTKSSETFGYPNVPLKAMIRWTADWVLRDMRSFGKKTSFEVRDGKY